MFSSHKSQKYRVAVKMYTTCIVSRDSRCAHLNFQIGGEKKKSGKTRRFNGYPREQGERYRRYIIRRGTDSGHLAIFWSIWGPRALVASTETQSRRVGLDARCPI